MNVALPAISDDLEAGLATQQWVIESYLLMLGSLILIGGSLSDLFGRRRVFTIGVVAFGVTSVLCAVAPDAELLIAGRALQGAAGALLVPSALAVIVATNHSAYDDLLPRLPGEAVVVDPWNVTGTGEVFAAVRQPAEAQS